MNLGKEIKDIKISFSDDLKDVMNVSVEGIDKMKESEVEPIELKIKTSELGRFLGKIRAYSGNTSDESYIIINSFTENSSLPKPPNQTTTAFQSCSDMGGGVCSSSENCVGDIRPSLDGECCIGECKAKTSGGGYGTIIGIILIIIVLAAIGFFYFKSKKQKVNASDILKKKQENFEERIKPKEVSGSLSKS
jgi:hypothetical protein